MADSDAVRSRRKRLHAAGDHSLCTHGGPRAGIPVQPDRDTGDGTAVDPDASLAALARRLEAAHEANPGDAQLARVLKDVLLVLRSQDEGVDRELAGLLDQLRS
jgi:hypothetical protein